MKPNADTLSARLQLVHLNNALRLNGWQQSSPGRWYLTPPNGDLPSISYRFLTAYKLGELDIHLSFHVNDGPWQTALSYRGGYALDTLRVHVKLSPQIKKLVKTIGKEVVMGGRHV